MTEKIRAIIWDMGGVILRTNGEESRLELAREFKVSVADLYNLVFNSLSAEKATIGLIPEEEHWRTVATTLGVAENRIQELQDRFWAGDAVDKRLLDYIRALNKNFKTGLLSNAWSGARQSLNQRNACDMVFQYSMFSYEVRLKKPDPEIYKRILSFMQVRPEEAIFVDDMPENIEGANSIGMHGIRFISTDQAIEEVNRLVSL